MINKKYLFHKFSHISQQNIEKSKIRKREFIIKPLLEINAFPIAISLLLMDCNYLLFPAPSAKFAFPLHND